MPLYEYQCDQCGHRFEVIQKFSDAPLETCPSCGGSVKKLLSSPAIQFKGSGWYITDYARAGKNDGKSEGKSGKASSARSDEGGSSADSGGETKSESKSESSSSESKASATPSKSD
jgi:putative FmdB family regulatory protein